MIKVLYVVAGDTSFDEMLYLDAFINQLPSQSIENHVLVPPLPLSHINLKNRNTRITQATPGFGEDEWQEVMTSFEPQIIVLCDPYILLSEDAENLTYMSLNWLDEVQAVVAVMDFRANLLKTPEDQLALDEYVLARVTPPYVLDYDFLIKVCPPHSASPTQNRKLIQWGCSDPMAALAMFTVRDEVRNQLGCKPGSRLVTMVFPVENTLMALDKGLYAHFPVLIETMIYYLNQLDDEYVLTVVNMPPPFQDHDFDNVQIRFFPTLDLELLSGLLKSTELFVTESLTYPGIVLSALRDIPTICLGSSLGLTADGQYSHHFENLSPFLQLKLDTLKEEAPETLFPYISFPSHFRQPWLQTELFQERYLYFLADVFDENRTTALINDLLSQGPRYGQFKEVLRDYRERKLGLTQEAESIIRQLVTAPPRNI